MKDLPEQYYGFVDSINGQKNLQIVFDSFAIEELPKLTKNPNLILDLPAFSIHIKLKKSTLKLIPGLDGRILKTSRWYLIETGSKGIEARYFKDIDDSEGIPLYISKIEFLHKGRKDIKNLYRLSNLDDINDATKSELRRTLSSENKQRGSFVAVYNVGQGNCNAVCNGRSAPLVYYDFGGGCYRHTHTYPATQRYCFRKNPAVVLSHWHCDHWCAAHTRRAPDAKNLVWIVPRQLIGSTQLKFARELHVKGKLKIWPQNLVKLDTSFGTIYKCTGRSRNNSGLAFIAKIRNQRRNINVLLPGDAAFRYIPNKLTNIDGLVAPHHGGYFNNSRYPMAGQNKTMVFSFGLPNSYGHPSQISIIRYLLNGWSRQLLTNNGHAAIGWKGLSLPILECGGRQCDLTISQI